MMPANADKLNNPIWYALNEAHESFALGTKELKRYDPGIVLFGGFDTTAKNPAIQLDEVLGLNESVFILEIFNPLPYNYEIETVVECVQMICDKPVPVNIKEKIVLLNESNRDEMYALVTEVFPGYYLPNTCRMGNYFGIYEDGRLAAMAGERFRLHDFVEVSAVVTRPGYTGRGFAQQLVTFLTETNLSAGMTPFLHTGSGNERAISVYELLGYKKRRLITATKIRRLS